MPVGHAESNDLLRNRERSMPVGHATRTEYSRSRKATQRSYNFSHEIIGNASISQVMNYEISSFIELTF